MEQYITCPNCGKKFALTQVITHQIEEKYKEQYAKEHKLKEEKFNKMMVEKENEFKEKYEIQLSEKIEKNKKRCKKES